MRFIEARRLLFRYLKEHGAYVQFMRNTKDRRRENAMYVDISKAHAFRHLESLGIDDGRMWAICEEYIPTFLLDQAFDWGKAPEGYDFWSSLYSDLIDFENEKKR